VRCAAEGASYRMIYTPRFVTIGPGSRLILKLLPQQFQRLHTGTTAGWDWWSTLLRWPQVAPRFMMTGLRIWILLKLLPQTSDRLSQIKPVHTTPTYLCKNQPNIILLPMFRFSWCPSKTFISMCSTCPTQVNHFNLCKYIRCRVQVTNFLIMQFSQTTYYKYFIPLQPPYSSHNSIFKYIQSMFFP
jgi:hypothetical protein